MYRNTTHSSVDQNPTTPVQPNEVLLEPSRPRNPSLPPYVVFFNGHRAMYVDARTGKPNMSAVELLQLPGVTAVPARITDYSLSNVTWPASPGYGRRVVRFMPCDPTSGPFKDIGGLLTIGDTRDMLSLVGGTRLDALVGQEVTLVVRHKEVGSDAGPRLAWYPVGMVYPQLPSGNEPKDESQVE